MIYVYDEKTGDPILLSMKEKENDRIIIFLDCKRSYYFYARCGSLSIDSMSCIISI
jgi:hypothetical protein